MGTGEINAGGNPAMDWHPIKGDKKDSQFLHATETGISSGLMGHLARMQTLPYLYRTTISASSTLDVYSISVYPLFSNSDNEEVSGTVKKKTLQKFIFSATLTLPKSFKRKGKEKKITKGEALGTVYLKISQCVNYEHA